MKLICRKENRHILEKFFSGFVELDIVLVERGIDYSGLHYTFDLDDLDRAKNDLNNLLNRCLIGYIDQKMYRIRYHDIVYIEGFSKEAYINTLDSQYLCHYKLYELEELLDNYDFIRINKSIIVNINFIDYLLPETNSRYALYMDNNIILILARSYLKKFKERLEIR